MKITSNTDLSTLPSSKIPPQKAPVLLPKKPLLKPRKSSKTTPRLAKKSGPPTPLLRWNFHQERQNGDGGVKEDKSPECRRKTRREKVGVQLPVSARKLAATLWRMHLVVPENGGGVDGGCGGGYGGELKEEEKKREKKESEDRLGFKPVIGDGGDRLSRLHARRECGSESKNPLRSPCSVNGPINGYLCERQSPFRFVNYAMEGATKWDPVCSKPSNEHPDDLKSHDQKVNAASTISVLEKELEQAQAHIEELEAERRNSKRKIEHFLKKLSEERAAWRSREHEKVRAIIDDVKADLSRERKNRQRLEIVNSKLVNELAEVKLSAKRYMQEYEKERKARALIEEVCDELAKEIGEDKAEVDSLKKECMKIREEVEEERKMLQMAEVWREERVQMKLVDAKVALDQKYSQMNYLVSELEKFLSSKGVSLDMSEMKEAEFFRRASASMNIQDIKEFTYEPSNPDDIFAVVEEMVMAESNVREIEPCVECSPASHASKVRTVSPETKNQSLRRLSNVYDNHSGDMDDDESGWETVSRAEDQVSSYSPEGSIMSVNRMCRDSNVSGSCTEWEEQIGDETPVTEISEVCSVPSKHVKKVKSISRLWRSGPTSNGDGYKIIAVDGVNGRLSNGRVSNGATISPDRGYSKGGISPSDMVGWNSPDVNRGMKGCIEWPRGAHAHKGSLKNKLLEARMESQKVQLRHVLKQKI